MYDLFQPSKFNFIGKNTGIHFIFSLGYEFILRVARRTRRHYRHISPLSRVHYNPDPNIKRFYAAVLPSQGKHLEISKVKTTLHKKVKDIKYKKVKDIKYRSDSLTFLCS